ncbi:hypothetical protein [Armatimonas sp.]|uniref:hypothetical protein n=1 Tax=Armatimonas sp. TaxID=1872638 RepID=UPI00375178DD
MIALVAPASTTPALIAPTAALHPPKGKLKPLSVSARASLKLAIKTRLPEDILAAKKALAAEGRYSCCITGGGCLECLLEGACACGPQLNNKEGVCKECVIGWKVGMGKFEGFLRKNYASKAATSTAMSRMRTAGSLIPFT